MNTFEKKNVKFFLTDYSPLRGGSRRLSLSVDCASGARLPSPGRCLCFSQTTAEEMFIHSLSAHSHRSREYKRRVCHQKSPKFGSPFGSSKFGTSIASTINAKREVKSVNCEVFLWAETSLLLQWWPKSPVVHNSHGIEQDAIN